MLKSNATPLCIVVLIFGCLTLGSARRDPSLVQPDRSLAKLNSSKLEPPKDDHYTQSTPANSSYFTIRPDMRRCASPKCGGYFAKQVNNHATRCADGKLAEECYVAEIDWNKNPSIEPRKALLRAELTAKQFPNFGKLGVMRVWEVWEAVADSESVGMFYRVRDRKICCIAFPCLTHNDVLLNSNVSTNIAGVDLKSVKAESNRMAEAMNALGHPDGLLATGTHVKVKGQAGQANSLNVTQFSSSAIDRRPRSHA